MPTEWSHLSTQRLGKYAEYYTKMEFTLHGFDVYGAEVDDKSIDFVIRKDHSVYYDIQVKSLRSLNYAFFAKSKFTPRVGLFAVVALFLSDAPPDLYLIPSAVWLQPNTLFVSRDYETGTSDPEWGINLSRKQLPLLAPYQFATIIRTL